MNTPPSPVPIKDSLQSIKRSRLSTSSFASGRSQLGSTPQGKNSLLPLGHQSLRSPRTSIDVENPNHVTVDIVSRHLVDSEPDEYSVTSDDEFDSLQLQGGDVTREIYNWKRDHSRAPRRSKSFSSRNGSFTSFHASTPDSPGLNVSEMLVPGGFRRNFIAQRQAERGTGKLFTKNFIEFLTLYGHFAGEEFSDEEDETEENGSVATEHQPLLPKQHEDTRISSFKAVLLLLKAFIGTGILFLPKGFYNGGIIFCVATLVFFSALSYWCFLLLIDVRVKSQVDSFGDIGKLYFGSKMRLSILTSIVLAQIGFAAAYIVFVAQNLKSVMLALFGSNVSISVLIFSQLVIFVPLSLTRKIAKLSGTALVADFFILLGIIYIYYNCTFEIATNGFKQVQFFNPNNWTIFIGTAVFTYEGIGLLIPIQKSMAQPEKFSTCLGGVMIGITFVFISIGAICYLAYGSSVQTVILNNFPQDSKSVNFIQLLYSLAILLSTPLQLFPAIRILENGIFGPHRSGKYNLRIKWRKNFFRIGLIIITSFISWIGNSDLDKFVALIGSFACIPLIYIYPPMLHIKSYMVDSSPASNKVLNNKIAFYGNMAVTAFGVVLMVYTSEDALQSWLGYGMERV